MRSENRLLSIGIPDRKASAEKAICLRDSLCWLKKEKLSQLQRVQLGWDEDISQLIMHVDWLLVKSQILEKWLILHEIGLWLYNGFRVLKVLANGPQNGPSGVGHLYRGAKTFII